ncbi:major facilitator superfamily domain-containing protein [Stachybotrys elegans]|uniref:Major facilitator superfamily domain-containing protein n=1 Tax=Stachybotrys elegans TaxID=80388 RepID=A0A8K0SWN6_9HYPO|nr:major facilitator superfamily domain-containing protein [Stachybotrys elegans]
MEEKATETATLPTTTALNSHDVEHVDEEPKGGYMQGWALGTLVLAFMSISFVLALDNTILATAIPQITSDFGSLNDIGWYGSSYLMAQMAMLPTCGRLYTVYNIKWTYCIMLVIFEIGSVISALAPNSMSLIVGRAVTGVGAAGLVSGATTIMAYCVALKTQAIALPIVFGMYGIGSAMGPLVGGAITDNQTLTWRFIFWMNLPFGAVGLLLIWFTLKKPPPAAKGTLSWMRKLRELDIPGAIVLLGSTTCLNLALQWGGIVYPWSHPNVFGCLIGFSVLLVAFIFLQARGKESSTIPLHIFRNRTVYVSCIFMMLVQVAIVQQTYYWPIYFQSVQNTSATESGVFLLPIIVSNSITTLVAGYIASKTGHYVPLMWFGAPILAIGSGLYQLVGTNGAHGLWIAAQILSGVGYGTCGQMPILAVQVVLSKADVPTGLVIVMFFQILGGTLAPSVGQNIFVDVLLRQLRDVGGIDGDAVVAAGGREFRNIVPQELMDEVIGAFSSALGSVFWVSLASPLLAWVVSWAMEWRKLSDRKEDQPEDMLAQDTAPQTVQHEG